MTTTGGTTSTKLVAKAVAAGYEHTCAVLDDGTLQCWGSNVYGELGNGSTTSSSLPVTGSDINNAIAVAAGGNFTCALLAGGTVQCWGLNDAGQLGNSTTTNSLVG